MSNSSLFINNELATPQSLDIRLGKFSDKVIRNRLAPAGTGASASMDVGDITTREELNANPQMRALLDASPAKVSISVARGTSDIAGTYDDVTGSSGLAQKYASYRAMASGGAAGTADDVLVMASAPYAMRITNVSMCISTAVAASTIQLRTAAAGGGSALSTAMSSATTGRAGDASLVMATVAKGGAIYARRSDRSAVGELAIEYIRLG